MAHPEENLADPSCGGLITGISENYEDFEHIGCGAFGTVYKAKDIANGGRYVAVKNINALFRSPTPIDTQEISMLKHLGEHPNIIKLLDAYHGERLGRNQHNLNLVFEYIDQDLKYYIEQYSVPGSGLAPDRVKDIARQILQGVEFMHSRLVIHRDLKPENILITDTCLVKIADFGSARILKRYQTASKNAFSLWYRPPEVCLKLNYNTAADLWGCGCIIAEMCAGRPLFESEDDLDHLRQIFKALGCPYKKDWPQRSCFPWTHFRKYRKHQLESFLPGLTTEVYELLKKMLAFLTTERVSAKDALSHDYFKESTEK